MSANRTPFESSPRAERSSPAGWRLGSVIAAAFGVIYIEVNAGSLPSGMALILRVLGAAVFLLIVIRLWLDGPQSRTPHEARGGGFDAGYWLIVALEALGIVAGAAVLRSVGLGSATVAWVSIVVGVHFIALAALWRVSLFLPLGAAIALCGVAAIAAATAGAGDGWVAGIGGVLPGGLLLWAATQKATTRRRSPPSR
jgi:hypothetical protein